jgi:Ras-related protein Rab-8A
MQQPMGSSEPDAYRNGVPKLPKVIVVGEMGVGKSEFLQWGIHSRDGETYAPLMSGSTICFDFFPTTRNVGNNATLRINFIDTAGQEQFHAITESNYRGAVAIVFMFDVTDAKSLAAVREYWYPSVLRNFDSEFMPLCFLLGTKTDLAGKRQTLYEDGATVAGDIGALYYETSAHEAGGAKARVTIDIIARTLVRNGVPTDVERSTLAYRAQTVSLSGSQKRKGKNKCAC